MSEKLIFAHLRGTVRTVEEQVVDGVKKDVQRMVALLEGDPLPATVPADELERLKKMGAVVKPGEPTNSEKAMAAAAAGKTPAEITGTGTGGGDGKPATLDLAKLAEYADGELAQLWASKAPKVSDVLEAVGADVELAKKALAAESAATKNDPRKTLKEGLDKVISASAGGGQ